MWPQIRDSLHPHNTENEGLREAYTKYFYYQLNVTLWVWKVSKQFNYS